MEQIRHTYLHYLIDPLVLKYPSSLKRLEPLLAAAKSAPMDDSFKGDISLLVTESFIRAVEAHTAGNAKTLLAERDQAVAASEAQGFILTRYFYDALTGFEKDEAGLRSVYGDMLSRIDVGKESKHAGTIKFAAKADPEAAYAGESRPQQDFAERRTAPGGWRQGRRAETGPTGTR